MMNRIFTIMFAVCFVGCHSLNHKAVNVNVLVDYSSETTDYTFLVDNSRAMNLTEAVAELNLIGKKKGARIGVVISSAVKVKPEMVKMITKKLQDGGITVISFHVPTGLDF